MKHIGAFAIGTALCVVLAAHTARADSRECRDADAKELVNLGEPQRDPRALRQIRSDHYTRIIGVMESFLSPAPPFDPTVTEQRFGAKKICTEQILPTLPPKIVLQFTLDDVRYRTTLSRVPTSPPN